ncbi:hypothetical protein [Inquilinus limosus]|uniref:DUF5333 domain-containing protein n=1 Tax=Inquilinus limosus TaxID=171674 RepID=A0A211ZT51_9PROT|nr:hypothetical protein [Inquilinus limosus]OWJ68356.1 hypothetical protein BWR60_04285 [Inquilinus limosus]
MGRASAYGLLVLVMLTGPASLALAAGPSDCRTYSYSDQRDLLVRKLKRDGYSAEQSKFLMWLSDLKASSIKRSCLTDEGRQCGAGSIKGMMLECARKFLDDAVAKAGMTPASARMDEIRPMALYGRTEFAVREMLALSAMEACSGSAKERFFSLPQRGGCLMDMDATPP